MISTPVATQENSVQSLLTYYLCIDVLLLFKKLKERITQTLMRSCLIFQRQLDILVNNQ
jgi:hypothetical protein